MGDKIKLLNGQEVDADEFYTWSAYRQRLNLDPELNEIRKRNAPKQQWKDWTGNKHSEETKQKIGEANARRPPISDETRKKMSDSRRGKPAPTKGRKLSPEHIAALKAAAAAKWQDPEYRERRERASQTSYERRRDAGAIKPLSADARKRMSDAQKMYRQSMSQEQRDKASKALSEAGKRAWAKRKAAKQNT